ncbi:hypothetical protein DW954_02165 [Clostridium sp. AM45-5]|nr:hypothetical protein [Clostridium sp. AM45-5]RHS68162.1 hypothetical protein DW954_02165 [Clostridium sp. AM45-5]
MKNIQCMEINNAYDSRLWNASTEKRIKANVNSRSRRVKKLMTHAILKGIGLGLLCVACMIEPSYGNVAVNVLYAACGVGLVVFG